MTAFIQVCNNRLSDFPARLLTFMGQSIRVVRSRGCGEGGHVTGLGETDCGEVGHVTGLGETDCGEVGQVTGLGETGCGEVGQVTGLGETGCCGVGMTTLEETVYGGMSI
jgi:hypothetical protein